MVYELPIRLDRPPIAVRWYHRLICRIAREWVASRCSIRTNTAAIELPELMQSISALRFRESVHETLGPPDYVMGGKCAAWTADDGSVQHPDVVDAYAISHCSIDINYIDDTICNITGSVAIDGWDSCSREYLNRQ